MEGLLDFREALQSFFEMEIRKVIAAGFDTEERPELFILFDKRMLAIGPEHVMPLFDTIKGGMELAVEVSGDPVPEELVDGIGTHRSERAFTGALEQMINGEVAMEDHVARPLD
jgi:hypothetical protein